ncbi:MAG: hypothetical protein ABJA61_07050 [Caldimonas sp.]
MKKLIVLAIAVGAIGPALAQPSVGVSIGINQPGVYGRINIGEIPPPALIVPQPVIIRQRSYVEAPPVYLYVPPMQQQNWRRYCGRYGACGQRVYFVRDEWVRERYEHEHPGWDRGRRRGWDKKERHDEGQGNNHEERGGHDKGHGHDHGKG